MTESVIFNSYLLLAGYGAAAFLCVFSLIKPSGYIIPVLSAILVAATTAAALLSGAGLLEVSLVLLVFLALNLASFRGKGGKK